MISLLDRLQKKNQVVERAVHSANANKPAVQYDGEGLFDNHFAFVNVGLGDHRQRPLLSKELVLAALIIKAGFHVQERF